MPGTLTIVGTGIKLGGHITAEAEAHIKQADKVFFVVANKLTADWIRSLNPSAESLASHYSYGKNRCKTYQGMVDAILAAVRAGLRTVAVFYGHPGVFVTPSLAAIKQARSEGYSAEMLPGISAEDCLYADLLIDPAKVGGQSFEATDFLIHERRFDPHSVLILWQIAVIGEQVMPDVANRPNLGILTKVLLETYSAEHPVTIYEAAQLAIQSPRIERLKLNQLPDAHVSTISTLVISPLPNKTPNKAMMARIGM